MSNQNNNLDGGARITAAIINVLVLFIVLLLAACDNSDGNSSGVEEVGVAGLISNLPENTRGVMAVNVSALTSGEANAEISSWLAGEGDPGAFSQAFQIIQYYSMGADIASVTPHLIVAQTTDTREGFILTAQLSVKDPGQIFDLDEFNQLDSYKGHEVFASVTHGLQLTMLDNNLLVIASEPGLRSVIDTANGDASSIAQGSIGPDLDIFLGDDPLIFVYGLPALYKTVEPPGSGAVSLSQAQLVSGVFDFLKDSFTASISIKSDNAQDFVARFNLILEGTDTPQLSVGETGAIDITIPPVAYGQTAGQELASLSLLKKISHGMDAVDYADQVGEGGNMPWMNFDVGGEPNSIFINFEFKDAGQVTAFELSELPEGFTLAPIRILDSDEPSYFLVLNIYGSSGGLVSGSRAEWSVFVNAPNDDHPRFMVVQAAASDVSADPVNLLTFPEPVTHELVGGKIRSYVGVIDPDSGEEVNYFTSHINWPQSPEDRVGFAREFVAANDYIFWGNGVADRGLYNATVHNREGVRIPEAQIEITDESHWVSYIKPVPKHSYVYLNPLDIVVSPWWNLDAEYLDVTPDHLQELIAFKNGFYQPTVQAIAEAAVAGMGNALAAFTAGQSLPSIYYHFEITDATGLESVIDLPSGTALAKIRLLEDDAVETYYLGLRVYQRDQSAAGARAEWVTYIADQGGRPYALVLDMQAEGLLVDPVDWLLLPAVVEHEQLEGQLTTQLVSLDVQFQASTSLDLGQDSVLALDWVEAGDRVCRLNGVCDKFYYDGQTMEAPVYVADPSAVNIWQLVTPWDAFMAPQATRVFVRDNMRVYATTPWHNVP